VEGSAVEVLVGFHPADRGCILVEAIIVQFIQHPETDQDATGQADGQAENIQKGIPFMPESVSQGDFEVLDPDGQAP
jgi:hypothetical protein